MNALINAIESGSNQALITNISDLREFADYIIGKGDESNVKNEKVESNQLKPLNYWIKKLNFNRSTLFRWENNGLIKPTRLGGKVYLRQSDFDNMGKEK